MNLIETLQAARRALETADGQLLAIDGYAEPLLGKLRRKSIDEAINALTVHIARLKSPELVDKCAVKMVAHVGYKEDSPGYQACVNAAGLEAAFYLAVIVEGE